MVRAMTLTGLIGGHFRQPNAGWSMPRNSQAPKKPASKQKSNAEDEGQPTLSGNGTKSAGQPARTESTVAFSVGSIDNPQRNFTPTQTSM
jgi:hypothetical protein